MAQLTSVCRWWCFIAIIALLAPVGAAAQDEATPFAATPIASDMSGRVSYGQDLADTRQAIDAGLSGDTIARLALAWRFDVEGPVSGTPIIAEGIVIVGSYDGRLYARDIASGDERWTYDTGAQVLEPNLNINLGISGSAAIDDGMVFQGGIDGYLRVYALDDGTEMFSVDLGGSVSGGIAITDGIAVPAAATPNFAPFVRPGMSVIAFAVAAGTATPAATAVSP